MARNTQFSINGEKVYPYTTAEAVIIDDGSTGSTLQDVLVDINAIKNANGETYTLVEKLKLQNIEVEANKYIHPITHPASIIQQDTNSRFVTDAQIKAWNTMLDNLSIITDQSLDNAKVYTDQQISALVNGSQSTLDTLKELADALGNNPNFATTISQQIGLKASTIYVDEELDLKYDKTGGLISGQVLTTIGSNKGIKFGTNYITSSNGNDLVLLGNTKGIRFSDVTDWNSDKWANIKYSDTTKTIYMGGTATNPITINMNYGDSYVSIVRVNQLNVDSKVNTSLIDGNVSDTSKYRFLADETNNLLEIATGDATYSPIVVRQYSDSGFSNLARTLTLLDSSGNTTLPGKLTCSTASFSGTVTVPTAATSTNNTQIASTAYVNNFVGSKKINFDQLHSSTTITTNTMTININIPTFDNNLDTLLVFKNGLVITDSDYTLNSNLSITSKDSVNGFLATSVQPTIFTFMVIKASLV